MLFQIISKRIIIDGGILTLIFSVIAVGILYFKPRLTLSDYPDDVKAALPPRTKKEFQQGALLSIPVLLATIAIPLYSVWMVKTKCQCELTFGIAFLTIFGEMILVSLFDLIVLDWLMFYTWTPKFLVLPGTEGFPGYKDFRPHLKAQLIKGNLIIAGFSALLALISVLLF